MATAKKKAETTPEEELPIWNRDDPPLGANLAAKVLWIQGQLGKLQKDSTVSTGRGGSFKAVSHDAVVAAVKPLLVQAGVLLTTSVDSHSMNQVTLSSGKAAFFHEVEQAFALIDVETGEVGFQNRGFGAALDTGDKGYGKAVSYGKKYNLLVTFLGETGDDVDQGEAHEFGGPPPYDYGPPGQSNGRSRGPAPGDPTSGSRPTLSESPHALTFNVPEEAWKHIARAWYENGRVISEAQRNRLFAIGKNQGWEADEIREILGHHLSKSVREIASGKAYDYIVAVFERFTPSRDDDGAGANQGEPGEGAEGSQEPPQDDIPF